MTANAKTGAGSNIEILAGGQNAARAAGRTLTGCLINRSIFFDITRLRGDKLRGEAHNIENAVSGSVRNAASCRASA